MLPRLHRKIFNWNIIIPKVIQPVRYTVFHTVPGGAVDLNYRILKYKRKIS